MSEKINKLLPFILIALLVFIFAFFFINDNSSPESTTALSETAAVPMVSEKLTASQSVETTSTEPIATDMPAVSNEPLFEVATLEINTDGGKEIVEKNTYIHGTLTLDGKSYAMKIRGRGNASWNQFPKKAYRIKLDDGASLFGLAENRDFVLASNYADKTLIRNCVAHDMAKSLSGLEYTPTHIPVNLYLNGKYLGVYTFADKIEDGNGRLSLGTTLLTDTEKSDIGFLLEIGWDYDSENIYNKDYFDAEKVLRIYVKEPEITKVNSPEMRYIKKYILDMEKAVISGNGWEEYIDIDSWIDWLIINELTFNTESSFYRSCYLYKNEGGKLCLGPVWDFDMAFGNHKGDIKGYDGWCTTEATYTYVGENWMTYLMQSPAFISRLKARWNEVKHDLLSVALGAVDRYSNAVYEHAEENFKVWDILDKQIGLGNVDIKEYNTYESQIEYLCDFINTRWSYIDTRINSEF